MTICIPPHLIKHLMCKKGEQVLPKEMVEEKVAIASLAYTLMPRANTYALGVQALRDSFERLEIPEIHRYIKEDGSKIIRPLAFRENLVARLEDFNTEKDCDGNERTEDDKLRFFKMWLDSCAGIAYKAKSTKFKIIPQCRELIEISPDFNQHYLSVSYDALSGVELDSGKGKYNEWLTKDEAREHPGWLAAVEDDKVLLKDYTGLIFALLKEKNKRDSVMGFFVAPNQDQDKLRALFVNDLDNYSGAYGNCDLNINGSFLRVTPVVAPKARARKKEALSK